MRDLTLLVPLYASAQHVDLITETVDDHVNHGARVLLSDQHHLDDAADRLHARYRSEPLVNVMRSDAGGNWVDNCNLLLEHVVTDYFRINPHDDSVPASSTVLLRDKLHATPSAVLAHGRVRGESLATGERLPARDEPRLPLFVRGVDGSQTANFTLSLMWTGVFGGSFKSVMRTAMIQRRGLFIRPTPTLRHSERAWLAGLSLVGEFLFCDEALMVKRYSVGSVSDAWDSQARDFLDVATVISSYVDDLVEDPELAGQMRFNLHLNALHRATFLDGYTSARAPFDLLRPTVR